MCIILVILGLHSHDQPIIRAMVEGTGWEKEQVTPERETG